MYTKQELQELVKQALKEGYGCYDCFDLIDGFEPITRNKLLGPIMKAVLPIDQKEDFDYLVKNNELTWDYYNNQQLYLLSLGRSIQAYVKDDIYVAWYWEGDGTLLVGYKDTFAINDDCKKDYTWEWVNIKPSEYFCG